MRRNRQSRDELESILGEPIRWLRFPYGDAGRLSAANVKKQWGLDVVYWTFSAMDSRARNAQAIIDRVEAAIRPGAIVLMHDCLADESAQLAPVYNPDRTTLLKALPAVGAHLKARELTAVTLTRLLQPV